MHTVNGQIRAIPVFGKNRRRGYGVCCAALRWALTKQRVSAFIFACMLCWAY